MLAWLLDYKTQSPKNIKGWRLTAPAFCFWEKEILFLDFHFDGDGTVCPNGAIYTDYLK